MSSRDIGELVPELVKKYYDFYMGCHTAHRDYIVTCTRRTPEEQKILVEQRKSKTMNSKHLEGKAFDIAVIKDGKVSWKFDDYKPYGIIGESIGLKWGGNFKGGFRDGPHFELKEG